jgi:hypothetical protein
MPAKKKKREKDYGVITPEKFKNLMRYYAYHDEIYANKHIKMEEIMCDVLEQHGYTYAAIRIRGALDWMHDID